MMDPGDTDAGSATPSLSAANTRVNNSTIRSNQLEDRTLPTIPSPQCRPINRMLLSVPPYAKQGKQAKCHSGARRASEKKPFHSNYFEPHAVRMEKRSVCYHGDLS
ncbi:MAG: hypothetical protein NBKEAIPA_02472 [Nitrospirae bacterium]|nr:MAG: hypothetical protein UZ03_NOB001002835 [Nitrospira sp. OLB3]MBV6470556.1 hypothetical protein [Nitrospirota bacterium]